MRFPAVFLASWLAIAAVGTVLAGESAPPPVRVPWTSSQIAGNPEPPSPYRAERLLPEITFRQPVEMVPGPPYRPATDAAGERLNLDTQATRAYVVERTGKVFSLPVGLDAPAPHVVLDGAKQIPGLKAIYGLAFHPNYSANRYAYLCYILEDGRDDGTRVSRFQLTDDDPPVIDPASETIVLTFLSGGHNGGSLKFGHDGCLYISTGDGAGPDPPDGRDTGQDLSDLLASVLRIDVDRSEGDRAYAVPPDNPFRELEGVRPEIWAYGFRNPWRMSVDRGTGDLWLGDVGWQRFEMVFRVERGGNYGWSIMEGPQLVRTEGRRGPTPILPATHALDRADAASITGGFVYHGQRHPELKGSYIYGDWVTGKIWALRFDGQRVTSHRELADTRRAIICFYEAPDGELAFLDYNAGTLHELVPSETSPDVAAAFPRKLSETGLFVSTAEHRVDPGVIPYAINAEQWMDGATAERFVAFPNNGTLKFSRTGGQMPRGVVNPENGVLVKTISIETRPGDPASERRIETQILHFSGLDWQDNGGEWFGYTYVWNADQSDADLAPAQGQALSIAIADPQAPEGVRMLDWRIHSRTECYACHNPWAGYRLGFTERQLQRPHDYGQGAVDQLAALAAMRVVELPDQRLAADRTPPLLVDPRNVLASLEDRARSYLHVNCAHCHRFGGGGTSLMQLDRDVSLEKARLLGERPSQGTFNLPYPALVRPGDPEASVLYYRIAKTGRGRMPHVGSDEIDWEGVRLIHDWIHSLPADDDPNRPLREEGERLITLLAGGNRSLHDGPDVAARLLDSPYLALRLQRALGALGREDVASGWTEVVACAARHPDPIIRDLFECFLPPDQRVRRLGATVDPATLLAVPGDADRGRALFLQSQTLACRNCHRVGEQGTAIGPDLTTIGRLRTREQLLESILEPSKTIDPRFVTYVVETTTGQVHTGLLLDRTETTASLRTAENKRIDIPAAEIEQIVPQQRSLMPDLLHRDLTAEQLADLLAYLESLK